MQVEVYADPAARAGVLEPEGIVEIKFKKQDLLTLMQRVDPELIALREQNAAGSESKIAARQKALLPMYHQVMPYVVSIDPMTWVHSSAQRLPAGNARPVSYASPWCRRRFVVMVDDRSKLSAKEHVMTLLVCAGGCCLCRDARHTCAHDGQGRAAWHHPLVTGSAFLGIAPAAQVPILYPETAGSMGLFFCPACECCDI